MSSGHGCHFIQFYVSYSVPHSLLNLIIKFQATNPCKEFTYACRTCVRQAVGFWFRDGFADHCAADVFNCFQAILELLAGIEARQDADDLVGAHFIGSSNALGGCLQPERAEIAQLDDVALG